MAQLNPKALRSNSVSESLAKNMVSVHDFFSNKELSFPFARVICETFLHVNNPEPQLTESILICLRDICGEKQRDDLVRDALIEEIGDTLAIQTLFRSGSVGTRLFAALYRTEGVEWLSQALRPLFNEVSNLTHPVEFDPAKAAPDATPEDLLRSAQDFEAIAKRFFNHLFMLAEDFPPCISRILCPVCEAAEKKFPGRGASVAGIGLVILRFVSPAVLQPSQFGVSQPEFSPIASRVIVVLSKVIQMVANGVVVKASDKAMQPIANFVQSLFNPCAEFIKMCTKDPAIAPLPPVVMGDGSVSKELRHALKVVSTEIDKNFEKVSGKAKEMNLGAVQAALIRLKNPPKPAPKPGKSPSNRFSIFRDHTKDADDDIPLPSSNTPLQPSGLSQPPVYGDEAVQAAHKALDDMLNKFRASILAYTGENFATVVNDFEKCKADLEKEREQRKVAERMVVTLQDQVQKLQQEIASLRAASSSTPPPSSPPASETPAVGIPKPVVPVVKVNKETPPAPTQVGMQSHLPCAPTNRQAVALLDEILMLSARLTRVSQVLYLARVAREFQRLVRTPFEEPFEFSKNITYNPTAGEDSTVSFEDEKMHGLRRAIPDHLSKLREWCINMLEDGAVSPTYYPGVCLRMQNLVELLKDVSRNLRASVFA